MATKTTTESAAAANPGMMGMGDLSVIRNILFGQQASEFESNFDEHTQRMDKTDADNHARFLKLEADIKARLDQLEHKTNLHFQQLEAQLAQTTAMFHEKIAQTSKTDRASIGQMLIAMGKQLSE